MDFLLLQSNLLLCLSSRVASTVNLHCISTTTTTTTTTITITTGLIWR
jgi:hypothetical protein